MIIKRMIEPVLRQAIKEYPIVAVLGPRQSGKTTLVQYAYPEYSYVSMSDLDVRARASQDPRKFFATYEKSVGLIIDEMQEVPELFAYMQSIVDASKKIGFFIITGSSNFLLMKNITQTLAGRISILELLPLSIQEIKESGAQNSTLEETLLKGFYPRLYAQQMTASSWYANYITTYVERDVRQILNISDVATFQKFLKMCAARTGNLINYTDLARDCDISPNTARAWLSVLEASYIISLLQPYYNNFSKRLVKTPKLYFYDVGLVCQLLGIQNSQDLFTHPMRGALVENLTLSELMKYHLNIGKKPQLYFWRDTQGHEIDFILEKGFGKLIPIEVKSGMTIQPRFYKELTKWKEISGYEGDCFMVYAGQSSFEDKDAHAIAWDNIWAIGFN